MALFNLQIAPDAMAQLVFRFGLYNKLSCYGAIDQYCHSIRRYLQIKQSHLELRTNSALAKFFYLHVISSSQANFSFCQWGIGQCITGYPPYCTDHPSRSNTPQFRGFFFLHQYSEATRRYCKINETNISKPQLFKKATKSILSVGKQFYVKYTTRVKK